MIRFSLFGIPVLVQPWFWITLVFIGGGTSEYSKQAILRLALFMLAGFISILVHELGHALTGRAFGARSTITLQAFGGYAAFSGARFNRAQHFLVTAAGPGIQLLLGGAVYFLIPDILQLTSPAGYFWKILLIISVFWALLNLLPVMPLDGGQMLNSVLGPQRVRVTLWITIITAVGTALLFFNRFGSFIFPLFLCMFAWQAWKALQQEPWR